MGKIERFEDLECWKSARELVKTIFVLSDTGKLNQDFETSRQLRRASLSIMNNIAEGFGRLSNKDFRRFLDIAVGSAFEVKSIIYVLEDLKYISNEEIQELHNKVNKTINQTIGLIRYLNKQIK
ncbi:four helix bundle protein [Fulvivirgaceae bacterium BMA10]|uniref:Four helix bundle protein n=1 Tax=Splendidivirga corallicola TaxID=3051826 RepID=A0ABT8KQW6_9BACT|nr:four helix bundle protein [Fulvivirgaceae bacterium BMA10]